MSTTGTTKTTARFTLHVPMYYPDGETVPDTELEAIEEELIHVSGGFTRHLGLGKWRSEENGIVADSLLVYTVDAEQGPAAGAIMQNLARRVAQRLRQESVYLTFSSVNGAYITP